MIILGLHLGHDGSACIVKDGRLVSALSSERLSRQRKSHGITHELIDYVLRVADVAADQVDAIALSDYHSDYAHGAIEVRKRGGSEIVPDTWNRVFGNDVWEFDVTLRGKVVPGFNVGHHLSHCAASFFTSNWGDAFCLSMDSSGGELQSNFLIAHGQGNELKALDTPFCMAGLAYGNFCEWLGIGSQMFKAGSMMALASYGSPTDKVRYDLERHAKQAQIVQGEGAHYRSWVDSLWIDVANDPFKKYFPATDGHSEEIQNIAASMQAIFEAGILYSVQHSIPEGSANLCLGGGSFLNCNVNSRILRESRFESVHLFPAASDDGCAVGAALYTSHAIFGEPRASYEPAELCYLGEDRPLRQNVDVERVAEGIAAGKVVAWVMGRSEYGPRALGHRSMLADPRRADMVDLINSPALKNREWYRPVCPSVLAEDAPEWFDHPCGSPFMLFTAQSKRSGDVPAAVHVDNSARHQTVGREDNPDFYRLIEAFKARTGVPMVLNTSLNEPGRPIIESREEALKYWEEYPAVDMLVLDGEIYER